MLGRVFRTAGFMAFGVMATVAMSSHAFAAERPSDGSVKDQLAVQLNGHCASSFTADDLRSVGVQSYDFDRDGDADPYVDVPTELLSAKSCDVSSSRVSWLSSRGYAPTFGDQSPAPAPTRPDTEILPIPDQFQASTPVPDAPQQATTSSPSTEIAETSSPPAAEAEGVQAGGSDRGDLVMQILIAAAVGLAVVIFIMVKTAAYSREKYGYALFLSWNTVLWWVGGGTLIFAASLWREGSFSETTALIALAAGLLPCGYAVYRNLSRTSPLFGTWATFVQIVSAVPALLLAIYMLLQLQGWRERQAGRHA